MTPAELLRRAEAAVAEIEQALAQHRAMIVELEAALETNREQVARFRKFAESVGTKELLHKRERFGSVSDVTRKHHGLAIARKAAGTDPFRRHITDKGISQNKLAKKVGCSDATLSRYRSGRPIPTTIANRIFAATGWPADAEHWPGGLV